MRGYTEGREKKREGEREPESKNSGQVKEKSTMRELGGYMFPVTVVGIPSLDHEIKLSHCLAKTSILLP